MAITLDFHKDIEAEWNSHRFKTVEEYEEYRLRYLRETTGHRIYYTDKNGIASELERIDHFPELQIYEVWSEGYAATGESGVATLCGKTPARNFRQACDIIMCTRHLEYIQKVIDPAYKEYMPNDVWCYEPSKLSDWGCRLFWSQELASKSFG